MLRTRRSRFSKRSDGLLVPGQIAGGDVERHGRVLNQVTGDAPAHSAS